MIENNDDVDLKLNLKTKVKSLLNWLRAFYIIGFTVSTLFILAILFCFLFEGILNTLLGTNNQLFNLLSNPLTLLVIGFLLLIFKRVYQIYKSLKKYQLSASTSNLVETFNQLKLLFRSIFFLLIYILGYMFFKYGVTFISVN